MATLRYFPLAFLLVTCLQIFAPAVGNAEAIDGDSAGAPVGQTSSFFPAVKVPLVDFKGVAVRDAISALFRPYSVNVWVSPDAVGTVSVYLTDVSLADAFQFLIKENGLRFLVEDNIIKVFPLAEADRYVTNVKYETGLLSLEYQGIPLHLGIRRIIEATGFNIVTTQGLSGNLTGILKDMPYERGLEALFNSNGFAVEFQDGIAYVNRLSEAGAAVRSAQYQVECDSGTIKLDVRNADLQRLIEEIAVKCQLQTILYGTLAGVVTVTCNHTPVDDAFAMILSGTQYTFKHSADVYQFGPATMEELRSSRFIQLKHLVADDLVKIVPITITAKVSVTLVPGQNGLMATGAFGAIRELEQFVASVDFPPAQILIEALVVDFATSYLREFSIIANNTGLQKPGSRDENYLPEIQLYTSGKNADEKLQDAASRFGISNIGHLSDDFYLRLRALSQEGKANIRSRPVIAALNGHEASISIGTTQYYLLKSETVYNGNSPGYTSQVSQRFETIKADVTLRVTPWVTSTGEIIVDIAPEFNTPKGQFDPDVPPTINHRTLKSTVRLRNGETIVLGGMIQTLENLQIDKIPLLGDIPILGRIFQNRTRSSTEAELMIFLTPKTYFGSEGAVDISSYGKR